MKFLGEYNFEAASVYKEKLEDEDIFPTVEEVGGYFGASWATMGTLRPMLRLFVEDGDYGKAVGVIKDIERDFEKKVEIDGKEADKAMIKIVMAIALIFLLGVVLLIGYDHL